MAGFWDKFAPPSVLFVSPHPDDICIAMGALAAHLARRCADSTMLLVTDGSEGRMAKSTLSRHGWTSGWSVADTTRLRGDIRVAEAEQEAATLGIGRVAKAGGQGWHANPATTADATDDYGALLDVADFRPSTVTAAARAPIADIVARLPEESVVFLPAPNDRQLIHRITTCLALEAVEEAGTRLRLAFYLPLSSNGWGVEGTSADFAFGDDLADIKSRAIAAHRSQIERRRAFGAYTSTDSRDYRQIAADRDRARARSLGDALPYAEAFQLLDAESINVTLREASGC